MAQKVAMIAHPIGPILLFSGCWLWYISITFFATFLMSYNFLSTSHLECTQSTCNLIKVMPLFLSYFIRPFMIVDLWVKILPIVYYDLLIMHCNIYGFTTLTSKLSLPIKKVPRNRFQTWFFLVQMKELCGS